MCIANLDSSNESGSHWVGIVKNSGKKLIYDSFGRKTKNILPNMTSTVDTEYDLEQGLLESNCGARSLAALCVYNWWGKLICKYNQNVLNCLIFLLFKSP